MLPFRRDPVRHRVRFTAETLALRYEIELHGDRWYVRAVDRAGLRAVGEVKGFLSYELARAAAAEHAVDEAASW